MVAKRTASLAMQARNARARALGYENYYQRRVAEGKARGLSRNVALGQPGPREVGITTRQRMLAAIPGAVAITAMVRNPKAPPKERSFEVDVIGRDQKAQRFTFDVRAKSEVRKLLKDAGDRDVPVEGTP